MGTLTPYSTLASKPRSRQELMSSLSRATLSVPIADVDSDITLVLTDFDAGPCSKTLRTWLAKRSCRRTVSSKCSKPDFLQDDRCSLLFLCFCFGCSKFLRCLGLFFGQVVRKRLFQTLRTLDALFSCYRERKIAVLALKLLSPCLKTLTLILSIYQLKDIWSFVSVRIFSLPVEAWTEFLFRLPIGQSPLVRLSSPPST